jgi:hypothetical protein
MSWRRVFVGINVVVGLFAISCVALCMRGSMHRTYVAEGNIEISPPGPPGVATPAAICMWANGYRVATPSAARESKDGPAYILCTLDAPVSMPFSVSRYSNFASGLVIGAFLVSIPDGHPACVGATGLVTVEDASPLDGLCDVDSMPPRSEVAMMAPFDDDVGRPTATMRIAITKAE